MSAFERAPGKGLGVKYAVMQPVARGRRFEAFGVYSFDHRREVGAYVLELAVGVTAPLGGDQGLWRTVGYFSVVGDAGLSRRLLDGRVSPYIGIGVLPQTRYLGGDWSLQLAPYAQVGVDFAPTAAVRLFVDLRAAQHLVRVHALRTTGNAGTSSSLEEAEDARRTELGLELGVAF